MSATSFNQEDVNKFVSFLDINYLYFQVFEPRINGKIKKKQPNEPKDIHHQWANKEEIVNLARKYNGQGSVLA